MTHRINIPKSELKILIIGNGLSKLPINLYKNNYTNIFVSDISHNAIKIMEKEHSLKCPKIKWVIYDITCQNTQNSQSSHASNNNKNKNSNEIQSIKFIDNYFDIIIDKSMY